MCCYNSPLNAVNLANARLANWLNKSTAVLKGVTAQVFCCCFSTFHNGSHLLQRWCTRLYNAVYQGAFFPMLHFPRSSVLFLLDPRVRTRTLRILSRSPSSGSWEPERMLASGKWITFLIRYVYHIYHIESNWLSALHLEAFHSPSKFMITNELATIVDKNFYFRGTLMYYIIMHQCNELVLDSPNTLWFPNAKAIFVYCIQSPCW